MAAKKKAAKAGAGAYAAGKAVRSNQYVQRLIEDKELRDNLRSAFVVRAEGVRASQRQGPREGARRQEGPARAEGSGGQSQGGGRLAARGQEEQEPQAQAALGRDRRRGRGARPERGPAQEGPRCPVRRRGGVRVHRDHHARAELVELQLERAGEHGLAGHALPASRRASCGAPFFVLAPARIG